MDYMRQMETILVAVGVPTRDHQGASSVFPQPATPAEGGAEPRDPPPSQDPEREETQNQLEEEGQGVAGDGWDIPDISDLLDSLDEGDAARELQAASGTGAQGNAAEESEAAALDGACSEDSEDLEDSEDDDPESGHISWSWEDTNWTSERMNKKKKEKERKKQQKHPDS